MKPTNLPTSTIIYTQKRAEIFLMLKILADPDNFAEVRVAYHSPKEYQRATVKLVPGMSIQWNYVTADTFYLKGVPGDRIIINMFTESRDRFSRTLTVPPTPEMQALENLQK